MVGHSLHRGLDAHPCVHEKVGVAVAYHIYGIDNDRDYKTVGSTGCWKRYSFMRL